MGTLYLKFLNCEGLRLILLEILKAFILGIIEGITEWLPVSSTGHMILADEFIRMNQSAGFKEMFLFLIQLGAIMAVVVLYFRRLNPFSSDKTNQQKKETFSLWLKVIIACIPGGIVVLLFDDVVDRIFFNYQTVAVTLILYGIIFILIEIRNKNKIASIRDFHHFTYKTALLIGVFQVLAIIPGTSRSGATIIGAMLLGASREIATEFTFFLAIPAMLGESLIKLVKFGLSFTPVEAEVLAVGMITAFLVSIAAIKFLTGYIKKHDFKAFGYYRIVLGIVVAFYFLLA